MKHMSTWDLLDLAKDYREFARMFAATDESNERYLATRSKLAAIDTELLSRMPEGEFMTVCDYTHTVGDLAYFVEFLPVGFEPYIGEDNEYLSLYVTYDEDSP